MTFECGRGSKFVFLLQSCLYVSRFQIRLCVFVVPFLFDKNTSFAVVAVHCCRRVLFCSWTRRRSREHWKFDLANSAPRHTSRRTFLLIWHIILFLYAPCYFGVNLHRSFQIVSSVPRGTTTRSPLQSFARKDPLSLPSPFCIRFVSVFFHPKLNVCKQDLWCLTWRLLQLVFNNPLLWKNSHGGFAK